MKKIVFTFALVTVLVCLFAISISAASTNEFADLKDVELVPGMDEKSVFGEDGEESTFTSRVVLYDSVGKEYHTYPAYYIFTNNVNTTTDFSQLNRLAQKSYGKTNVIRAEVPNNVQKVTGDIFKAYNDLKYVRFPDTLKEISGNMFYTSHGLEWVNVPRDCVSIGSYAFYGCSSLVTIDMSNAQSLKRTEVNQFYNCPNLKELIFPEGFEYFGGAGGGGANQTGLASLETLYLPDSVTYMGTISEARKIGTFVVPQGITSLRDSQFHYCVGLNKLVVHKGVTSISSSAFRDSNYIYEFVYTGSENDDVVQTLKSYKSMFVQVATVTMGNHCDYYYGGEHLDDTNPCVINCTRCDSVNVPKKNPVHAEITGIEYVSFDAVGTVIVSCSNEGCAYSRETEAPAIFKCLGYSAPESGTGGIALGFMVDKTAVADYERISRKTLKYGIFAVSQEKLGNEDIFGLDGAASQGVVSVDLTRYEFSAFELKIVGFEGDQKSAKLAMGAYVGIKEGNETTYSYMQDDSEGDLIGNYYFVSYNEVAGVVPAE